MNDKLHDEIITAVNEQNGIRISALSKKLRRNIMTLKYRVLLMSAMKELEIQRGPGCFKIYPCEEVDINDC
jgi:hypothetical protein